MKKKFDTQILLPHVEPIIGIHRGADGYVSFGRNEGSMRALRGATWAWSESSDIELKFKADAREGVAMHTHGGRCLAGERINAPGWKSESLWRGVRFSSMSVPDDYLKQLDVCSRSPPQARTGSSTLLPPDNGSRVGSIVETGLP